MYWCWLHHFRFLYNAVEYSPGHLSSTVLGLAAEIEREFISQRTSEALGSVEIHRELMTAAQA